MLEKLKSARKKVIGTKQTTKALDRGIAQVVFVAEDADDHLKAPLLDKCREKGVEVVLVSSMKELGEACGIEVGAASAALLE